MSENYECHYGNGRELNVRRGEPGRFVFRARSSSYGEVEVVLGEKDIPRLIAQLTAALPGEPSGNSDVDNAMFVMNLAEAIGDRVPDDLKYLPNRNAIVAVVQRWAKEIDKITVEQLSNACELPDEGTLVAALKQIASWGLFEKWECPHTTADAIRIAIEALGSTDTGKPDDDSMEVRIAVVTSRVGCDGEPSYYTKDSGGWQKEGDAPDDPQGMMFADCISTLTHVTARVPLPPKPVVHEVEGKVEVSDGS